MPVLAANTAIILWNGANVETANGFGDAQLVGSSLGGVSILASTVTRDTNPNELNEANILIVNTTSSTQTLHIIAGANGYLGPSSLFALSGAINVNSGSADLAGEYFVDGGNSLNGQTESVTGLSVNSFDSGGLLGPFSFAHNGFGTDAVSGSYGLAESLTLTLGAGASIGIQGLSIEATGAVPEPSTWAMGIAGFGFLAFFGLNKARKDRLASV
jgi:hypothetical protein